MWLRCSGLTSLFRLQLSQWCCWLPQPTIPATISVHLMDLAKWCSRKDFASRPSWHRNCAIESNSFLEICTSNKWISTKRWIKWSMVLKVPSEEYVAYKMWTNGMKTTWTMLWQKTCLWSASTCKTSRRMSFLICLLTKGLSHSFSGSLTTLLEMACHSPAFIRLSQTILMPLVSSVLTRVPVSFSEWGSGSWDCSCSLWLCSN